MLENSMSKDVVYQNIHDKLQLDSITKLNMTAMEEECNKYHPQKVH
ncbi:hypothetical protein MtrunA17_Chr4g0038791 [Medicago truncatula]|uniref:Uncharacterized protein n=1 Tax=Medicago truncatula TaxID=3880 RepID=A0A396I7N9_MEDTR|nr:hypothetical protein MtrunA17_Chr4g0038791 [Medicago truncatula]